MIPSVQKNLLENLQPNDTVILGISGGPDSTALLRLLVEFALTKPIKIIVAHVNHGIRGRDSVRDELFVKKLSAKYKLKFELKRVRLAGMAGVEEKGRAIRRDFFEKLAKKYKARFILTAHTKDDNVETIVFNFLRGTGIRGLAGMQVLNGIYLRPLIGTHKKELLDYLKDIEQPFCKDATNDDATYSRNFVRKKILPMFERINPSFREGLIRNSKIFFEVDGLIRAKVREIVNKKNEIDARKFSRLPNAIQTAVIQEMYRKKAKNYYSLPNKNVQQVIELVVKNIGNKKIQCPGHITFVLKMGILSVT